MMKYVYSGSYWAFEMRTTIKIELLVSFVIDFSSVSRMTVFSARQ
jgi:hypothetical protein